MIKNNITTICAISCTLLMIGFLSLGGFRVPGLEGFFIYIGFYIAFKLHEIENIFKK